MIDMEAGARVAGSRFAYLKGDLVLLEMALFRWALELLGTHGFEPVVPPVLVREEALYGTGFLPDTEQQIYRLADDDLYLVGHERGAAGVAARRRDPRRRARCRCATPGISPCFRREAGAAGRDTRGILRVHQFDKVEMFSFVEPEAAGDEHELLLALEEELLRGAGDPLPRRQHRRRRPRRLGREEVRPRGVDARPGPVPRGHVDLEHDRLPVAPARHPLPRPRTASRATCTRSTAPRSPGAT